MFFSILLTDPNTIPNLIIWCKYSGFKIAQKKLQLIWKKYKESEEKWSKTIENEIAYYFFVSRKQGQLKGRTSLYLSHFRYSDIFDFLVTVILICKVFFWSTEKRIDFCFISPVKPLLLSLKCFFVKQSGRLRNKLI